MKRILYMIMLIGMSVTLLGCEDTDQKLHCEVGYEEIDGNCQAIIPTCSETEYLDQESNVCLENYKNEMLQEEQLFEEKMTDDQAIYMKQVVSTIVRDAEGGSSIVESTVEIIMDLSNNYLEIQSTVMMMGQAVSSFIIIQEYEGQLYMTQESEGVIFVTAISDIEEALPNYNDLMETEVDLTIMEDLIVSKNEQEKYIFTISIIDVWDEFGFNDLLGETYKNLFQDAIMSFQYEFNDNTFLVDSSTENVEISNNGTEMDIYTEMKIQLIENVEYKTLLNKEDAVYNSMQTRSTCFKTYSTEEQHQVYITDASKNYMRFELEPGFYQLGYSFEIESDSIKIYDNEGTRINYSDLIYRTFQVEETGYYYIQFAGRDTEIGTISVKDIGLSDISVMHGLPYQSGTIVGRNENMHDLSTFHFTDDLPERALLVLDVRSLTSDDPSENLIIDFAGDECDATKSDYCYFIAPGGIYGMQISGDITTDFSFDYWLIEGMIDPNDQTSYESLFSFDEINPLVLTWEHKTLYATLDLEPGNTYKVTWEKLLWSSGRVRVTLTNSLGEEIGLTNIPAGSYTIKFYLSDGYDFILIPTVEAE